MASYSGPFDHGGISMADVEDRLVNAMGRLRETSTVWLVYCLSEPFQEDTTHQNRQRVIAILDPEAAAAAKAAEAEGAEPSSSISHLSILELPGGVRVELANGGLTPQRKSLTALLDLLQSENGALKPIGPMFVPREATELWEAGGVSSGGGGGQPLTAHECPFSGERFDTWRELLDHLDAEYAALRLKGLPPHVAPMPETNAASLASSGSISSSAGAAAAAAATAAAAAAANGSGGSGDGSDGASAAVEGYARDWTRQFADVKRKLKKRKQQQMQFKVVERLGQMLYEGPSGTGGSRKKFEQSLVEWVPDNVAPMCPDCGSKFGFKVRKHHCRLCGGILCKSCSDDLEAGRGQQLHSAASLQGMQALSCPPHFRVCKNCLRLCEGQKRLAENIQTVRLERDAVVRRAEASTSVYEVLFREVQSTRREVPEFFDYATRMAHGEGWACHDRATTLRAGILRRIGLIQKMGAKLFRDTGGQQCQMQVRLAIREMTLRVITESLVRLVQLPDAATVAKERESTAAIRKSTQTMMNFDGDNIFELWQHERRHPSGMFGSNALDEDKDVDAWGSEDGSWGYSDRGMVNPRPGFSWSGAWLVDTRKGDEDGWTYSIDFDPDEYDEEDTRQPAVWVAAPAFEVHNVRRRRWGRDQINTRERSRTINAMDRVRSNSGGDALGALPSPLLGKKKGPSKVRPVSWAAAPEGAVNLDLSKVTLGGDKMKKIYASKKKK